MKKPPPVPCLALLRTRIGTGVPQRRLMDPATISDERRTGLQAPNALLAPSGYSYRFVKSTLDHEHRRGRFTIPAPSSQDKDLLRE